MCEKDDVFRKNGTSKSSIFVHHKLVAYILEPTRVPHPSHGTLVRFHSQSPRCHGAYVPNALLESLGDADLELPKETGMNMIYGEFI